ncbi:low-specificity L-threonine aldolase [Legionella hackeliae]|uniref:Low specificity L-threonine aldolase n=1 Tax=Legionella hackeliae TaxID=449 RepID=A0A0A8UXM6_LEGHA|nr:low-specificity L-threonine aldolase [Legionella hackeliae]KTD12474.1 Low specificity L-threonine aldolase [Legionella hackeliae]CEK11887.1 Low specificity L-threonine aldolase [Legionella hackeliae]STX48654.1 Low specificity L-threonine aldolase [Legionella hackeliae]
MKTIDLRSDTMTKPSHEMLQVMMQAEVGDDVWGEDPTAKHLEALIADKAGMEAAVFAPSGTQSNLMGLMAHCERGDEYIVGQSAHTYRWEGGGAAVLGSIQPQPLDFASDGSLPLDKVTSAIKPWDDHHPRTKLLCLENTTDGKVVPLDYLQKIPQFCQEHQLKSHLDGARVFNAVVKLQVPLIEITKNFDSVSICLSKGLGAPVGSVLCGSKELIKRARRWRKVLGGGMRQVGILAAAGIYALEQNIERLNQDHENAFALASALAELDEVEVDEVSLQTNILFIRFKERYPELQDTLEKKGVFFPKQANKQGFVRLVTHLDISKNDIAAIINEVKTFYKKC